MPEVAGILGYKTSFGPISALTDEQLTEANLLPVISETEVIGDAFPAGAARIRPRARCC